MRLFEQYGFMAIAVVATALVVIWASIEIHEQGHTLACVAQGAAANRTSFVSVACDIEDDGMFWVRLMGGMFAAMVLFSPILLWHRFKNHVLFRGLLITCIGFGVGEFGKGIAEPFNFPFYVSDDGDRLFAIVTWITVFVLGFFVRPRRALELRP